MAKEVAGFVAWHELHLNVSTELHAAFCCLLERSGPASAGVCVRFARSTLARFASMPTAVGVDGGGAVARFAPCTRARFASTSPGTTSSPGPRMLRIATAFHCSVRVWLRFPWAPYYIQQAGHEITEGVRGWSGPFPTPSPRRTLLSPALNLHEHEQKPENPPHREPPRTHASAVFSVRPVGRIVVFLEIPKGKFRSLKSSNFVWNQGLKPSTCGVIFPVKLKRSSMERPVTSRTEK